MIADDAKLLRKVMDDDECSKLQENLNEIHDWSVKMGNGVKLKEMSQ